MNREERKRKLANAIKTYRGLTHPQTKKWIHAPQKAKRSDIVKWLVALGRTKDQINEDAVAIDGFKTMDEFTRWMATI